MSERRGFFRELLGWGAAAAWAAPVVGAAGTAAAQTPASAPGKKLGFALVGLGSLSENQIAPALFQKTKLCKLTGLVSGHADKAMRWAKQYGVPEKNVYSYQTFDQIKNNPDIDVVYVVLPNSMHAEYTIRAAKAGKHVLCEKPMAVSVKECDQMIAACQAAGRKLAIGYRLHFEPNNREMVRLAREKTFGAVKVIETAAGFPIGDPSQWRLDKKLAGGGSLMDIGIYALQAARYISGEEPTSVSAQASITDPVKFKPGVDESILFTLKFPSGIVANCASSYATGLNRFRASAERGWFELQPALNYEGIKGRMRSEGVPKEFDFPPVDHFAAEMDDFADCILNGKQTRVPGEEGRRDVRIMTAIYESAASGKRVSL
ncbi:MAG TPA: Gfo/Idh/MocA family oxidoreductase [Polyangiaceae bacterium]|nr:Gfo/Idh/MocA family oxidoreductase [Polyangiaceae bacterium]